MASFGNLPSFISGTCIAGISIATSVYYSRKFFPSFAFVRQFAASFGVVDIVKGIATAASLHIAFATPCYIAEPLLHAGLQLNALSMLLRYPESLRATLRNVRVALGPVFPILCLGLARINPCVLTQIAAVAATVAATAFRPDNRVTAHALGLGKLTDRQRTIAHGLCLMMALCLDTIACWRRLAVWRPVLCAICALSWGLALMYYRNKYLQRRNKKARAA
eukprot:TRINITY_DN7069_c0_g1_i1.p1 TRINITY_DN7069_c0_g1~~TRINITY_DN7069_c0_g1_i1.p1  ORF type:complete len:221 (+),score=25.96 TRINITY_DN7069_c0_g1_i1:318-980(+)